MITDGDTTLAESGAILEYLVETYGEGRLAPPAGTPAYRDYRYFMQERPAYQRARAKT